MELQDMELVASLQELPETDPVEIDGLQLGGGATCQCVGLLTLLQTVCIGVSCG